MNRILYILTAVMLLLTGCVKETADSLDVHDYNMTVRLPAPSLDDEKHQEAKIKTVQLIMVQGGEVRYDHYYTDVEYAAGYTYTITDKVKLPLGDYQVYVICNLNKVENTGANFPEAAIVEIPGMIYAKTDEFRIPMYGKTTCELEADKPLSIVFDDKVPLERLMSKITLDFKADGDFAGMKITNISIKQFCSSVQLGVSQTPVNPSAGSALEHTMPTDAPLVLPAKYPATFYIPETYVDPGSPVKPYVEVSAIINNAKTGGKDLKTKYKLEIETNTPNAADKSYVRNTQYDITATVKGYGNADDMFVKVNVLPWNMSSTSGSDGGDYVQFTKTTDAADKPIADGSNLDDMGTTLKVSCNTNIGGWYTVTRDMNNMIVHKSSPTASVSVATSQTVEVTIPAIAEAVFGQNYTINIYHPTIAMESVGPVKSLNFIQSGGFIPSSVLAQSFESLNTGTIQGWPADRLPARGLQIAKRGDQILPSGVAQADDLLKQWKTSDTSTSGTAEVGVGMGKHSTDAMIAAGADEHPAAKYCREMGPEWYLPSRDELLLIYNYKAALGTSYTFYAIEYWSATESRIYSSWYVHFYNGYTGSFDKTGNVRVRCVREF